MSRVKSREMSREKSRVVQTLVSALMVVLFGAVLGACSSGSGDSTQSETTAEAVISSEAAVQSSVATATDGQGAETDAAGVRVVGLDAAQALLADQAVTVIDVRTPEEFATGHLERAQLVDFNAEGFADRIGQFPRDGRYLVYCRSGNRSGQALEVMRSLGFTDVADVDGGVVAWTAAGLPLVNAG